MRLFRALVPYGVGPLFLSEIILIGLCFCSVSWVIDPDVRIPYFVEDGAAPLLIAIATIMLSMFLMNLYASPRVRGSLELLQQLSQSIGLALIAQSVIGYVRNDLILPKWFMIGGCLLVFCVLFVWRLAYSELVVHAIGNEKLLFLGESEASLDLARFLAENPDCGFETAGFLSDTPSSGVPWLGPVASLREVAAKVRPSRIIVGMPERRNQMPVSDLFDLRFLGYSVEEARIAVEDICARVSTRDLQPARVIFHRELEPASAHGAFRNALDRIFAAILLLVACPFFFIIIPVVAVRHGRVFATERRIGLRGRPFRLYRFASVFPLVAMLPALWNVLRGDMALVGPAAERPEFVKVLSAELPLYHYRHRVRPGLVGWAQMHEQARRQLLDALSKLEYDLYFIKHATVSMHLLILLSSLKNALSPVIR